MVAEDAVDDLVVVQAGGVGFGGVGDGVVDGTGKGEEGVVVKLPRSRGRCGAADERGDGLSPLFGGFGGFADDGRLVGAVPEDGVGEVEHGRGGFVAAVAEGGGGSHGRDAPQGAGLLVGVEETVGLQGLQAQTHAAQEQCDVGALGTVVGVELVECDVLQRGGGLFPEGRVGVP